MISAPTAEAYIKAAIDQSGYIVYEKPADTYPIKITDKYIFEDPADIIFDTRYVLYGGEKSQAVTGPAQMGLKVECAYSILYAKDTKGVKEYTIYVMSDEAGAKSLQSIFGGIIEDGRLVIAENDNIQESIEQAAQYGMISAPTAEAYIKAAIDQSGYITYDGSNTNTVTVMVQSFIMQQKKEPVIEETFFAEVVKAEDTNFLEDIIENEEDNKNEDTAEEVEALTKEAIASAGTVTEKEENLEEEELFDYSASENSGADAEEPGISEETVCEAPAETFDPSTAGNAGAVTEILEVPAEPQPSPKNIQITAEYTYMDPEGLEYNERFVYYGASDSLLAVQTAEETLTAVSDVYIIIYVKDGKVLTEYRCYVMDNQVICNETKPEDLEALLNSLSGMETPYEVSPAGYGSFMEQVYGLRDIENEG